MNLFPKGLLSANKLDLEDSGVKELVDWVLSEDGEFPDLDGLQNKINDAFNSETAQLIMSIELMTDLIIGTSGEEDGWANPLLHSLKLQAQYVESWRGACELSPKKLYDDLKARAIEILTRDYDPNDEAARELLENLTTGAVRGAPAGKSNPGQAMEKVAL